MEVVETNRFPILDHFLKTEEHMSILGTLYPGKHTWETLSYGKQSKEEKKKEGGREGGRKEFAAAAKSPQSCPTLCDPIDGSPPGSPVPAILQARTLEWVAISFSNA